MKIGKNGEYGTNWDRVRSLHILLETGTLFVFDAISTIPLCIVSLYYFTEECPFPLQFLHSVVPSSLARQDGNK